MRRALAAADGVCCSQSVVLVVGQSAARLSLRKRASVRGARPSGDEQVEELIELCRWRGRGRGSGSGSGSGLDRGRREGSRTESSMDVLVTILTNRPAIFFFFLLAGWRQAPDTRRLSSRRGARNNNKRRDAKDRKEMQRDDVFKRNNSYAAVKKRLGMNT